jgi:hypothetical protein
MATMGHQPYPLEWPLGKPRAAARKASHFKALGFGRARDDLFAELKRFGAQRVVLSTNVPLRLDGIPYANMAQPHDPGAAVYFELGSGTRVRYYAIACDAYRKVEENLRALVHTLDAMRTIERHGSSQMLEQAMSGFAALPPANAMGTWWRILGFDDRPTLDEAKIRYRELVTKHHPDRGGSEAMMVALNEAIRAAGGEAA